MNRDRRRRAANTRAQWQRLFGREPAEFKRVAREYLFSGQIEGWRFRQELCLLYFLGRDVLGDAPSLEIGSFRGLATIALAYGIRAGKHAPLSTVDPHPGHRQDRKSKGRDELSSLEEARASDSRRW